MEMVHVLDHPLLQHKLSILRDETTGVRDFREIVGEIATLMCYDATRNLPLEPVKYYCKMPTDIAERDVIILDPMLATGGSASAAITFVKEYGVKNIKLMNILAAPEGIERVRADHPDVEIYVAAVDEKLNEHGYIVPGLGDAGDRIFGTK